MKYQITLSKTCKQFRYIFKNKYFIKNNTLFKLRSEIITSFQTIEKAKKQLKENVDELENIQKKNINIVASIFEYEREEILSFQKENSEIEKKIHDLYLETKGQYLNKISTLKSLNRSYENIMNLFGGKADFNKLPELEYKSKMKGPSNYLENITPNDMSTPIMRGKDDYGRLFFVIRYKNISFNHEELQCVTFFQGYTNIGQWNVGARTNSHFMYIPKLLGTGGHIYECAHSLNRENKSYYTLSKEFISTGTITFPQMGGFPSYTYKIC